MCGRAINDFPHRFLSPADLKVVVTVCRLIFKFYLTLWKMWKKINSQAVARCRESFSSLVFSQALLSQTQPWGNATDTQFFKVSHFYSLFSKLFFNNYNIQTIAIRFAMVRKITFMTKISNGLLDQVTHGNRIDLSLYLETFRSDQKQMISSKYVSSKVVYHPGLRTLSVGHVDLAGCMKYIQEFYLSIQILTNKKQFELWKTMSLTGLNIEWVVFGLEVIKGLSGTT